MAFAQVQTKKATSTGGSGAITAAFGSNVTAGNRLLMFTDSSFSTGDIATPTKSAGTATISTFTRLAGGSITNTIYATLWTATVTGTGTCTLSATSTGELGFTAAEYSGLDGSAGAGCLDVSAAGTGNSGNTSNASTGTTAATTGANQLGLCMVGDDGATATWTLATANGFVKDANLSADADSNASIGVAAKTSASGATESAVWTNGGNSDTDVAWVAVIKLAASTAGSPATSQAAAFRVGAGPPFQPTVAYEWAGAAPAAGSQPVVQPPAAVQRASW